MAESNERGAKPSLYGSNPSFDATQSFSVLSAADLKKAGTRKRRGWLVLSGLALVGIVGVGAGAFYLAQDDDKPGIDDAALASEWADKASRPQPGSGSAALPAEKPAATVAAEPAPAPPKSAALPDAAPTQTPAQAHVAPTPTHAAPAKPTLAATGGSGATPVDTSSTPAGTSSKPLALLDETPPENPARKGEEDELTRAFVTPSAARGAASEKTAAARPAPPKPVAPARTAAQPLSDALADRPAAKTSTKAAGPGENVAAVRPPAAKEAPKAAKQAAARSDAAKPGDPMALLREEEAKPAPKPRPRRKDPDVELLEAVMSHMKK